MPWNPRFAVYIKKYIKEYSEVLLKTSLCESENSAEISV
jgi:hypothetical protein